MTKVTERFTLQVTPKRAAEALPRELAVGNTVLKITTPNGKTAFEGRWTKGSAHGAALVVVRPVSKTITEIEITLEAPDGWRGVVWTKPTLARLADLLERAVRYEIDTKSSEQASAFEIRRTTPELVKARTA